jgi:hypothetical protein
VIENLCATGNSARTKILRGGYLCDTKVVHANYWRNKEVMHGSYRCMEHELPCGFTAHAKYGFTD